MKYCSCGLSKFLNGHQSQTLNKTLCKNITLFNCILEAILKDLRIKKQINLDYKWKLFMN